MRYALLVPDMWVVVNIMVPDWIPIVIRNLIFRAPQKGTIVLTTTHVYVGAKVYAMKIHGSCKALQTTLFGTYMHHFEIRKAFAVKLTTRGVGLRVPEPPKMYRMSPFLTTYLKALGYYFT